MIKKILSICFGIILVTIGLVGGLIPIFQGWLFGIPGLIILSRHFPFIKHILKYVRKKWKDKGDEK